MTLEYQGDRVMLPNTIHHQRGEISLLQGVLSYKYEEEKNNAGMTAYAGLPVYLDLASVLGLADIIHAHMNIKIRDGLMSRSSCR